MMGRAMLPPEAVSLSVPQVTALLGKVRYFVFH